MGDQTRFDLPQSRLPEAWYNLNADMPVPMVPPLHPETKEPVTPEFLSVLSPMALLGQDVSPDAEIEIPEPVREIYRLWRPTPLFRARRLEQHLETCAHIYYKYEGVSPVGSHKPNTAVAQAFFPLWSNHPAAAGLRVHVSNGLYANAVFDRLIGNWSVRRPS